MEGILGIFGIAVLVMEGVELFHSSSTNTLVAAGVACIVYIFYKFCDFSKKDSPDDLVDIPKPTKESKHVGAFYPHMDKYLKEYQPEDYDYYCDEYGIVSTPKMKRNNQEAKESLDAAKYAKPTTNTVSAELQQKTRVYNPDTDNRQRVYTGLNQHLYLFHVCYKHFDVDLTLVINTKFDYKTINFDQYPEFRRAYERAGSPKSDDICCASVSPNKDKKGNQPYIPADIRMVCKANIGVEDMVNEILFELNRYFGDKPCYFFQCH